MYCAVIAECRAVADLPREDEVDELTDAMFPDLVEKSTAVTNHEGWAGGRAAAELAQLSLFDEVKG